MTIAMTEKARLKMWSFFKALVYCYGSRAQFCSIFSLATVVRPADGLVDENPSFGSDSIQFL